VTVGMIYIKVPLSCSSRLLELVEYTEDDFTEVGFPQRIGIFCDDIYERLSDDSVKVDEVN